MKYIIIISVFVLGLLFFSPTPSFGQVSSGIATYVQINDTNIKEGDLIRLTPNGYKKTTNAYDSSVFGVVTDNPSVSFENTSLTNAKPVISSGKVYVNVTAHNGPIKKGDVLTSSSVAGYAQKATDNGYVIGTAAEDFNASNNKATGKILVILNFTYNTSIASKSNNIFKLFTIAADAPYLSPLNALRYVFAAIMVILSFIIAVYFFGRVSATGVEAIGRNPLASKMIMLSVIFNLLLSGVIIGLGVAVGYIILVI
jgi:F0F1-type ATP synthase membrane subunit c/vacuolar-type H+-ATPase subunit K